MYFVFIKHWLEVFPLKQLKIVHYDDYIEERAAVAKDIFDFLGLGEYNFLFPTKNVLLEPDFF